MSKPNPGLLERAHLIPFLQRDIEAGAGMRPNELCDALADALKIKSASLLRKWFHWRQVPGQQIPRVQELRVLAREAKRRGWIQGIISPEAAELLRFLEEDYVLRQSLALKRSGDELKPEIAKFSVKVFEILMRWDRIASATARENALEKAREKTKAEQAQETTTIYKMAKRAEEKGKPAETYGLLDTIPEALKDISQALVDRIKDLWPDYETRPSELSPENLRWAAELGGTPFLRFAAEAQKEREELLEYMRDLELSAPELAGCNDEYRLGDSWKIDEPVKPT